QGRQSRSDQDLRRPLRPQGRGRHVADEGSNRKKPREDFMIGTSWSGKRLGKLLAPLAALALLAGPVAAKDSLKHVSVAVGGGGCLCYLPTMPANQIGEYEKAGLEVELINFKGG